MSQRFWRELRGYAEALLIAYFIVTFLFTTVGVVGSSMRPNLDGGSGSLPQALWQGDRVFIPKLDTWLRRANVLPNYPRGEIVVVREPKNAPSYFIRKRQGCTTFLWMDQCRPFFIKRLIAVPGDSVKIEKGKVGLVTGETTTPAITPQTQTFEGTNPEAEGYTVTMSNITYANITGGGANASNTLNTQQTLGTNVSKTVTGTNFTLAATSINIFGTADVLYATLTIVGRGTGARLQVPFELRKSAGMQ